MELIIKNFKTFKKPKNTLVQYLAGSYHPQVKETKGALSPSQGRDWITTRSLKSNEC